MAAAEVTSRRVIRNTGTAVLHRRLEERTGQVQEHAAWLDCRWSACMCLARSGLGFEYTSGLSAILAPPPLAGVDLHAF